MHRVFVWAVIIILNSLLTVLKIENLGLVIIIPNLINI